MIGVNSYSPRIMDCKKNFHELLNFQYPVMKLFAKKFEKKLFAIKFIAGLFHKFGVYGEKFRMRNHQETIEDLKIVFGKKAIDIINSPALMASINISQEINLQSNGKIRLTQNFPCLERNILKVQDVSGECFKLLAFPLSIGGYAGWNQKKFIAVVPTSYRGKGSNFTTFLYEAMSYDINDDNFFDDLQEMSHGFKCKGLGGIITQGYCCGYEMCYIDRVKKTMSIITFQKKKGKYVIETKDEIKIEDQVGFIGSDKAVRDQNGEEFKIEI